MLHSKETPKGIKFNSRSIIFEQKKSLSKCHLWEMERQYFADKGIEAWLHDVPFYITSNPFIAKAYANVVVNYIRDWITKHPEAKQHPFYVMELGTGPGQFSYYTIKAINELREDYGMHDVNIVFVMTDFAEANLRYHQSHHALMPFVESGQLDFAIHDMEKEVPPQLIHSKVVLDQTKLVNPLCVFANYVFDTIPNDAFSVQNGVLSELLVNLSTPDSNLKNNKPVELSGVTVDYQAKEISSDHYDNAAINQVLDLYKNSFQDTSFLLPIGSIRGLDYLRRLANNNFLLISSDKAYTEIEAMENLGHPSLTIHGGCFSMMANCHAIGQYFQNIGGDFFTQSVRGGLKTCVYTSGATLSDLPQTRIAVKNSLEKYSPTDFFNNYRNICEMAENSDLDAIASFMQLSDWDPHVYRRISSYVLEKVKTANIDTIRFIANNIHKLSENYYFMPNVECIHFAVAIFFHAIADYAKAIQYYQLSEKFIGEEFSIKYNIALCLTQSDKNMEALEYFKAALRLNPDSQEATDWISHITQLYQNENLLMTAEEA